MKVAFKIEANQQDITAQLKQRLLSMKITDEAGIKSDTCEMVIDDRSGVIELPAKGAQLTVYLGYETLFKMGVYTVDEVELSGPVQTLTIRAKATDTLGNFKQHKSRTWEDVSLVDIVATIAAEHGLQHKVDQSFANHQYTSLVQHQESDLNLLTRLAEDLGAIAKPAGPFLVFAARGQSKAVSGQLMPTINLDRSALSSYRFTMADRGKFNSVQAHWHNQSSGETISVIAQTSDQAQPQYQIKKPYTNKQQALTAAKAKLAALQRGEASGSLSMLGQPELGAESQIMLSGVRTGVDGPWLVTKATHSLSTSGFQTQVDIESTN